MQATGVFPLDQPKACPMFLALFDGLIMSRVCSITGAKPAKGNVFIGEVWLRKKAESANMLRQIRLATLFTKFENTAALGT